MMVIRLLTVYLLLLLPFSLVHGSECSLIQGEIINTEDCRHEALLLRVELQNLGLCTSEPTPNDITSCEFFNLKPGVFEITSTTETALNPTRHVSGGRYSWMIYFTSADHDLSAAVEFDSDMAGAGSTFGKYCWTNGKSKRIFGGNSSSRSDWTTDCGSSLPDQIPTNRITIDSFQSSSFDPIEDVLQPSGRYETSYLLNASNELAQAANDVVNMMSTVPLDVGFVIPDDPSQQKLVFTFDRSQGAYLHINDSGSSFSYVDPGVIEVELTN